MLLNSFNEWNVVKKLKNEDIHGLCLPYDILCVKIVRDHFALLFVVSCNLFSCSLLACHTCKSILVVYLENLPFVLSLN